jgi:hypothetical protein
LFFFRQSNDSPKASIFVKVDTLRDGSSFVSSTFKNNLVTTLQLVSQGLEGLYDTQSKESSTHQYSLISRGCTLIHLPRSRFKEMMDAATLKAIKPFVKTFPSDEDLCHEFAENVKWNSFKQGLVDSVLK